MALTWTSRITETAIHINNVRGYGDIRSTKVFLDGRVEFTIARPFMADTVRRGRIIGDKIRFLGTTRNVEAAS